MSLRFRLGLTIFFWIGCVPWAIIALRAPVTGATFFALGVVGFLCLGVAWALLGPIPGATPQEEKPRPPKPPQLVGLEGGRRD